MRTNCEPMTPATAANKKANTTTAASTDQVCPRPMCRSARTKGAINRLKITASVMGTSTSRAKYSNASTVAVAMIPRARSRIASGGGSGKEEAGDAMRYIRILPGRDRQ